MNSITVTLPYPLSVNRYWMPVKMAKHLAVLPTKEGKKYRAEAVACCVAQGVTEAIVGRVHVDVQIYPARPLDWQKRMRTAGAAWDDTVRCIDIDNARKVIYDALKGVAFDDDKWVWSDSAKRMEPDGEARAVVTITALTVESAQVALLEGA